METKKRELEASLYAARLGIAPKIYYVAPRFEAVLMDFVNDLNALNILVSEGQFKLIDTSRCIAREN